MLSKSSALVDRRGKKGAHTKTRLLSVNVKTKKDNYIILQAVCKRYTEPPLLYSIMQ